MKCNWCLNDSLISQQNIEAIPCMQLLPLPRISSICHSGLEPGPAQQTLWELILFAENGVYSHRLATTHEFSSSCCFSQCTTASCYPWHFEFITAPNLHFDFSIVHIFSVTVFQNLQFEVHNYFLMGLIASREDITCKEQHITPYNKIIFKTLMHEPIKCVHPLFKRIRKCWFSGKWLWKWMITMDARFDQIKQILCSSFYWFSHFRRFPDANYHLYLVANSLLLPSDVRITEVFGWFKTFDDHLTALKIPWWCRFICDKLSLAS